MSPETQTSFTLSRKESTLVAPNELFIAVDIATCLAEHVIARYQEDPDLSVQVNRSEEGNISYAIPSSGEVQSQHFFTFSEDGTLLQATLQTTQGFAYYYYYPNQQRLTLTASLNGESGQTSKLNFRMSQVGDDVSITANEQEDLAGQIVFEMNYGLVNGIDLSLGSVTFDSGYWIFYTDKDHLFPAGRDIRLEDILNLAIDPSVWNQDGWPNISSISKTPGFANLETTDGIRIDSRFDESSRADFPKVEGVVFPSKDNRSIWKAIIAYRPHAGQARSLVFDIVVRDTYISIDSGTGYLDYDAGTNMDEKAIEEAIKRYVRECS